MSIASEIQRLQSAKVDLKTAIEAKGVTVPSNATIDTYDDYVAQISGGGGLSRNTSGTPYCTGHDLYVNVTTEISIDGGTSWVESGVTTVLVESGSTQCYRLPQGYTEVEYIENPSMAYLDSGFKPNQDTRILFTFKFEKSQSSSMLIGAGGWDRADGMLFDYEQNLTGTLHISWGGTTSWSVVSSVHGDYNVHTYDWNKNEFYLDNTLVDSTTYITFQCTDNLGVFSVIQYPYSPFGQQFFACGRLYDFKIYDDGTLVRDFVPCINPNNVVGVYDIVNDTFYTSVNQGYDFVAGPAV